MKSENLMGGAKESSRVSASRRAPAEKRVRIKVVGVGGAGVNAIDRLVEDGFDQVGLLALNTDAQALAHCMVADKLQIGERITHGLGAGGDPDMGRQAALE
ncbi:MAG: cell division protein FtsZ, partial [Verrucomicrobiia bacterium]